MSTPAARKGYPIVILGVTATGGLEELDRAEDATLARKAVRDLPPGTYHIARYLDEGVQVVPPAPITTNQVVWGTRHIQRADKPAAEAGDDSSTEQ